MKYNCCGRPLSNQLLNTIKFTRALWAHTLSSQHSLWREEQQAIARLIEEIDHNSSIEDQTIELEKKIVEAVRESIRYYRVDDLIIATVIIKDGCRLYQLTGSSDIDPWAINDDYIEMPMLQKIIALTSGSYFRGKALTENQEGKHGLVTAISLLRILGMLKSNMERYRYKPFSNNLTDFVSSLYEDERLKAYYDEYAEFPAAEQPEDLNIQNPNLKQYLEGRGLLPDQIKEALNKDVEALIGFTFKDATDIFRQFMPRKIDENATPVVIHKKCFEDTVHKGFSQEKIRKILKTFSINDVLQNASDVTELDIELRSVFETENILVFGFFDLIQNTSIFEKLVMSGHGIDRYVSVDAVPTAFQQSQKKLSTYLSYIVAEWLASNGYVVPVQTVKIAGNPASVIRAEIDKIEHQNKNILQNVGDIDVLALNSSKNELLIIELKYFKPGITIKEQVLGDTSKIVDKNVIKKIKARSKVLKDNQRAVAAILGVDTRGFNSIRSIIVTARPNFFGAGDDADVEYMHFTKLLSVIENKEL